MYLLREGKWLAKKLKTIIYNVYYLMEILLICFLNSSLFDYICFSLVWLNLGRITIVHN